MPKLSERWDVWTLKYGQAQLDFKKIEALSPGARIQFWTEVSLEISNNYKPVLRLIERAA